MTPVAVQFDVTDPADLYGMGLFESRSDKAAIVAGLQSYIRRGSGLIRLMETLRQQYPQASQVEEWRLANEAVAQTNAARQAVARELDEAMSRSRNGSLFDNSIPATGWTNEQWQLARYIDVGDARRALDAADAAIARAEEAVDRAILAIQSRRAAAGEPVVVPRDPIKPAESRRIDWSGVTNPIVRLFRAAEATAEDTVAAADQIGRGATRLVQSPAFGLSLGIGGIALGALALWFIFGRK